MATYHIEYKMICLQIKTVKNCKTKKEAILKVMNAHQDVSGVEMIVLKNYWSTTKIYLEKSEPPKP